MNGHEADCAWTSFEITRSKSTSGSSKIMPLS